MQNNIENKIKQEFQNREIKPSNNSWEILNAQLELSSTKQENKKLKFLAYAAIFIGLLFSVVAFFNSNKTELNQPIIVAIDSVKVKNPVTEQINIKEILIKKEDSKIVKVIVEKPFNKSKKQKVNNKSYIDIANVLKNEKIVLDNENVNTQNSNNEWIAISNKPIKIIKKQKKTQISENVQEVKTANLKKKLFSSDADIDLMLANALKSDANKAAVQEITIQTTYLQYSIESEINTPIGNKILKTLKAGVDTVEEYVTSNN